MTEIKDPIPKELIQLAEKMAYHLECAAKCQEEIKNYKLDDNNTKTAIR